MSDVASPSTSRDAVIAAAIDLFASQGFDQTSVEQIAAAAGVSRSTFFRQFGGKDDVIFADHEALLDRVRAYLDKPHESPWAAVCEASVLVFRHFETHPDMARRRYTIVREVPSLREREIITVFRYERLFDEFLRQALPGIDPLDAVSFAAVVTAVHNHVLRQLLRGTRRVPVATLRRALDDVMRRFGVHPQGSASAEDDITIAVFSRRTPVAEVTRRLTSQLS